MGKFIIIIIMGFLDPTMEFDSFKLNTYDGRPFTFQSIEKCYDHVEENLLSLTIAGMRQFPDAVVVERILCVDAERNTNGVNALKIPKPRINQPKYKEPL